MIQIKFKNLQKSEFITQAIKDRLSLIVEKFPGLVGKNISATVEMHNSPKQAGPDLYSMQVYIRSGRYRNLTIRKSANNIYVALAEVVEHLLETLNRAGDRRRVKQRVQAYRWKRHFKITPP